MDIIAELEQIVDQTNQLDGSSVKPQLLQAGSAAPDPKKLGQQAQAGFYIIGLIGGKEVGKSSLVNALAGRKITETSSWGEGTARVIAYLHRSRESAVRQLLQREVPEQFEMVLHDLPELSGCVLLDLPDFDSHWNEHVKITRKMLTHMLYPVWMQSVEKYADQGAQDLLKEVAQGNSPENFVFVLNKVDQIGQTDNELELLRADYARRLRRALDLSSPPNVFAISTGAVQSRDFLALQSALLSPRSRERVEHSIEQASRCTAESLLQFVRQRDVPGMVARADRLMEQGSELVQSRLAPVAQQQFIEPLLSDAGRRLKLVDDSLSQRLRAWPLVNVIHVALWPVLMLIRTRVSSRMVDSSMGFDLSRELQGVFSRMYQANAQIGEIYADNHLWEPDPARKAVSRLEDQLHHLLRHLQRKAAEQMGKNSRLLAPVRWLITLGALVWFPIVQPLLEALWRQPKQGGHGWQTILLLLVSIVSVGYLIQSVVFLLIWYFIWWLILRWHTQRRVDRLLDEQSRDEQGAGLRRGAYSRVVDEWLGDLLAPLGQRLERLQELQNRISAVENQLKAA